MSLPNIKIKSPSKHLVSIQPQLMPLSLCTGLTHPTTLSFGTLQILLPALANLANVLSFLFLLICDSSPLSKSNLPQMKLLEHPSLILASLVPKKVLGSLNSPFRADHTVTVIILQDEPLSQVYLGQPPGSLSLTQVFLTLAHLLPPFLKHFQLRKEHNEATSDKTNFEIRNALFNATSSSLTSRFILDENSQQCRSKNGLFSGFCQVQWESEKCYNTLPFLCRNGPRKLPILEPHCTDSDYIRRILNHHPGHENEGKNLESQKLFSGID